MMLIVTLADIFQLANPLQILTTSLKQSLETHLSTFKVNCHGGDDVVHVYVRYIIIIPIKINN